jgi:hypothetical protein
MPYQSFLTEQCLAYGIESCSCSLFLRFKDRFVTYHTTIYDKPFKCRSFIVSFSHPTGFPMQYGDIVVFVRHAASVYALVQAYSHGPKSITDFVDIPSALQSKAKELFPLLKLSDRFLLIPIETIRHKCVSVSVDDSFCLTDIRVDYEHD